MQSLVSFLLLASVAVAFPMGGYGGQGGGQQEGGYGGSSSGGGGQQAGGYGGSSSGGGGFGGSSGGGGFGGSSGGGGFGGSSGGQSQPIISRQIYVFQAPAHQQMGGGARAIMPPAKIDYNIVFVKTPAHQAGGGAIVAPAPQQKTIVYVLNKHGGAIGQKVLEAPSSPAEKPEVFYVNYEHDHENHQLPGGIDLQTALNAMAEPIQVITSQSGRGAGGFYGGSGGQAAADGSYGSAGGQGSSGGSYGAAGGSSGSASGPY